MKYIMELQDAIYKIWTRYTNIPLIGTLFYLGAREMCTPADVFRQVNIQYVNKYNEVNEIFE